jgi:hypothetical protein
MKAKSFLNALLTLTLALFALNSSDADASRRKVVSVDRCRSLSCSTVFLRNPSVLALQLGLLNNHRFGFGHRSSGYGHGGHGYGYFAALRLALIRNAYARLLSSKDFYRSNNPYPYLGVNTLLLQGENGFLPPLEYASPDYKPRQVNLEQPGAPANEARPVNPGDQIETPANSTHGTGETANPASGRPTAAVANGVTPVAPISSQQRESAETFPSNDKDWRYSILAQAVRDTGARSANGKKSDDLCARALAHSQNLAIENSGRQSGFSVHHNGLPSGVFEIAAVVTAGTAAEAAASCVRSWQTSGDSRHPEYMNASFGEYCYAAVPVGTVYGCTGVFRGRR